VDLDYPKKVRFQCIKCGICCGDTKQKTRHILLLTTEAKQIAAKTSHPISDFAVEIKDKTPYVYEMKKTMGEGKCVFLKNNQCTIYMFRPLICRFYPFELKTSNNRCEFLYTDECPGINNGKKLGEDYFKKLWRLVKFKSGKHTEAKQRHVL
jgi:Fe-S-cluster containining protein